ncbi:protein-lysine N-methyltransferase Efm5p [Monosporozyma servazzii]
MSDSDSDSGSDIELTLSANALAALAEFKLEEQQRQEEFQKLHDETNEEYQRKKREEGMALFKEDWQLSQFWYSDSTADMLADALLDGANEDTVIAVVSAPSVFAAIQKKPASELPTKHIYLFEYDKRFELLAGKEHFAFYDYNDPLEFDSPIRGKVDRLLIDPPFLNEDCQTKSSITAKALLVPESERSANQASRLISCTGERMHEVIFRLYPTSKITSFIPEHANGLSNEFKCYANFEWKGWSFEN